MVAEDLRPGIHEVDVGLGANPRQARRISRKRVAETGDADTDEAAGEIVHVHIRDTESGGIGLAVIRLPRFVMIMRDAKPELGEQRRTDHAIVIDAAAVSFLKA